MAKLIGVIGSLALIASDSWRWWSDGRRNFGGAAAAERVQAYEAVVGGALKPTDDRKTLLRTGWA